ncbi:MAG: endolytic transglycosylase MltG, partial [Chloroflexota bacterium]
MDWLVRLGLFAAAVGLCMAAGLLLYTRWQDARLAGIGPKLVGGASLNPVQSLYLRGYLASRAGDLTRPAGSGEDQQSFVVDPGQSADEIAANLVSAGLLTDHELFLNYLRYYDLDSRLEAGAYEVSPKSTIPELAAILGRATDLQVDLTFVEGWRLEEMARYLELLSPAQIDSEEFLTHARRQGAMDLSGYDFLSSLPDKASLEGFLFPDTYRIPVEADAAFLIGQMLANFDRRVTPAMRQSFGAAGLSVYEAVTLASIVQREAVLSEERPLMVGVFLNRLDQGMLLQADPTVQYAVGYQPTADSWWKVPLYQT